MVEFFFFNCISRGTNVRGGTTVMVLVVSTKRVMAVAEESSPVSGRNSTFPIEGCVQGV